MRTNTIFALAASLTSTASAAYQGFNYGTTLSDGSIKTQQTFEDEFNTAKGLIGTSGWTSARLYTTIVSCVVKYCLQSQLTAF
jgi:glucan endo-1,3-beta-D-glucosidase